MGETRLYRSRLKLGGQVVAALTLALICLWMVVRQGGAFTDHPAGSLGVLLFGLGAAFRLRDWLQHEPILVLGEQGVSGPGIGAIRFVPWHAIERIAMADRRGRAVLLVIDPARLREADRALMQIGGAAQDSDGRLTTQIKVRELAIGAQALATLLAERTRATDAVA